jgi:hypothetical protein
MDREQAADDASVPTMHGPFNVTEHYKVHDVIGEGAYGVVA